MGSKKMYCSRCQLQMKKEQNFGEGSIPLCQCCYDEHYTRCYNCEKVIPLTEAQYNRDNPNSFRTYCKNCL